MLVHTLYRNVPKALSVSDCRRSSHDHLRSIRRRSLEAVRTLLKSEGQRDEVVQRLSGILVAFLSMIFQGVNMTQFPVSAFLLDHCHHPDLTEVLSVRE